MPVLATVTTVFFSLVGAEITTVAAAESKDPEKAVVRMATTITWRILLFYVLSLFLIVSVVAWPIDQAGRVAVHAGAERRWGSSGAAR